MGRVLNVLGVAGRFSGGGRQQREHVFESAHIAVVPVRLLARGGVEVFLIAHGIRRLVGEPLPETVPAILEPFDCVGACHARHCGPHKLPLN
jgi:hypothetical protein